MKLRKLKAVVTSAGCFQTQIRLHPMTESRSGIALQVGTKFGKELGILTVMLIASGMCLEKGYEVGGRAKYIETRKQEGE